MNKLVQPRAPNRRSFIETARYGAITSAPWTLISYCDGRSSKGVSPVIARDSIPNIDLELIAIQREIPNLSASKTTYWFFDGQSIKGDKEALETLEDSSLGPIFTVQKGQRIRIRFKNKIPEETTIHWHGMHVPEKDDGQYDAKATSCSCTP